MTAGPVDVALEGYRPEPGLVDEALSDDRTVKDHWRDVGTGFASLGLDELRRRQDDVRRLLEADGASYRLLDSGRAEAWKLDAVPLLMSSTEWATIESGVTQRAVLLDLVLRDLYGERKLLQRKVIPPEVVFGHDGFIPVCDGVTLPGGSQLFSYAVDLGRDASGRFNVIADHAQAPAGSGYALENRVVLSRVFPSLYRDARVHQVAPFFRALRAGLEALGSHRTEYPRVVVLTPGSHSETSFEHGYLASYLGYGLVEGNDLVVRNGSVYLRALDGLEPVDVVLRRVDAAYSDPLELWPESRLGVPGLLEACRRGTVTVVNTIGSGAIENPALNAFLPAVSEALLGQELRLDSVPTWWCGDPDSLTYVLDNLDRLVVKPIDTGRTVGAQVAQLMSGEELDELRQRILASPRWWTAHDLMTLSTSPTLTAEGLQPRRTLLRTYAVANEGSFTVMAGGLTRVAADSESPIISSQVGAVAKDTWVLSSEPERPSLPWLQTGPPSTAETLLGGLSERAAENLFWVGRYGERSESVVRLLRAVHDRRNDSKDDEAADLAFDALLDTLAVATFSAPPRLSDTATDQPLLDRSDPAAVADGPGSDNGGPAITDRDAELFAVACDAYRPGSLAYAVSRLLRAAEAVRDQLSIDTWQVTSNLERQLLMLSTATPGRQDVVQGSLGAIMQSLLALHGLAGESMVRDAGWYFMEAGRRVERFHNLAVLLRASLARQRDRATDGLVLESILVAAESIVTYRRRYRSRARVETLLDLLVLDAGNPRSLLYQVDRLDEALAALPPMGASDRLSEAQRRALSVSTEVRLADTTALAATDDDGARPALVAFCERTIAGIEATASAVADASFGHHLPQRTLDDGPVVS